MKRLSSLILAIVLIIVCVSPAYASGAGIHWEDIRWVLFGKKDMFGSGEILKKRHILEQATSLVIDQYQGTDGSILTSLRDKGVLNLPGEISVIDLYAGSDNHREFTHCGWNYPYKSDSRNPEWSEKRWPMRQQILRSSVEYVFNFNGLPSFIDQIVGSNSEKCDAFCRLLYCIHVLGDHNAYTYSSFKNHKGKIIPMGGFNNEMSIITELLDCFQILFPAQGYSELVNELEAMSSKIRSMLNNEEKLAEPGGFQRYTDYAQDILHILHNHVPGLMQNEEFFKNVFPYNSLGGVCECIRMHIMPAKS